VVRPSARCGPLLYYQYTNIRQVRSGRGAPGFAAICRTSGARNSPDVRRNCGERPWRREPVGPQAGRRKQVVGSWAGTPGGSPDVWRLESAGRLAGADRRTFGATAENGRGAENSSGLRQEGGNRKSDRRPTRAEERRTSGAWNLPDVWRTESARRSARAASRTHDRASRLLAFPFTLLASASGFGLRASGFGLHAACPQPDLPDVWQREPAGRLAEGIRP
jgi:hypothetical protein